MKVFNDIADLPPFSNAVITIGSFDGVHHGHQQILKQLNDLAKTYQGESVVITFHPHPRHVLKPDDKSLKLITTVEEKVALFAHYGVDNVVVVPFTPDFSQQSAEEYVRNFLVERFQPRCIVIGYDHRFGNQREGSIELLKQYHKELDFQVEEIAKQDVDDIGVSSSKIRLALNEGDVRTAQTLLGHPFTLSGTVIRGAGLGKKLFGYPTANLDIASPYKLVPPSGIYAVRATHQEVTYDAVLYIGDRPSLNHLTNRTIEAHLFDFDQDIYGDQVHLEFVDHIRPDARFENLEELKAQMMKDADKAINILRPPAETPLSPAVNLTTAVVILNYNGKKWLEKFLPSVTQNQASNVDVIVADNASTDDSIAFLKLHYPQVRRIQLSENLGFAQGYNEALRQVESEIYVLLNSDVEVTDQWLTPILHAMKNDPSIGACQPKIKAFAHKDQFEYAGASGGWMDYLGYPFCRGRLFDTVEMDQGQYDTPQEIFWASGAALFVRAKLFHDLGGFDGDYFAHMEEIDLCWRIKRAGYKLMAIPQSVVYHVGGGTLDYGSTRKTYLNFRNILYTLYKNEKISKLSWLIPTKLVLDGLAGLMLGLKGGLGHTWAVIRAHFSFYGHWSSLRKKRTQYQKLIQQVHIGPPNTEGLYPKSVVWQYYLKKVKYFKNLGLKQVPNS